MIDVERIQAAARRLGARNVLARLGIAARGGPRTARAACPIHGGKNPTSFAVSIRDDRLVWRCCSCNRSGDVIGLVRELEGLSDFVSAAQRTAELLGAQLDDLVNADPRRARGDRRSLSRHEQYPSGREICTLWMRCPSIGCTGLLPYRRTVAQGHLCETLSSEAQSYLIGRGWDLSALANLEFVREIPRGLLLPGWARIRGSGWYEAGYRLLVSAYDASGTVRSLRGWRVGRFEDDLPKRIAPAGYRTSGLVTANSQGVLLLSAPGYFAVSCQLLQKQLIVRICEGEPDTVTLASVFDGPILGALSASAWPPEIGDRIPVGATVIVFPDADQAGEKLVNDVAENLGVRCDVRVARIGTDS